MSDIETLLAKNREIADELAMLLRELADENRRQSEIAELAGRAFNKELTDAKAEANRLRSQLTDAQERIKELEARKR